MLSSLLAHADDDPQTAALLREGGEAFVSQSLRPYLVSALLDRDPA
jgi:transcription-repair coupling factor (superfamily II helicase)